MAFSENTKPYQTNKVIGENVKKIKQGITKHNYVYEQKEMPIYFFQLIANGMHTYVTRNNEKVKDKLTNQLSIITAPLNSKYLTARNKLIFDIVPPRLNVAHIESAHMTESYYFLTKKVTIVDFE